MSASPSSHPHEWRWVLIASSLLLLIVALPVLMAYWLTPPDMRFMGFLVNPVDGAGYLEKMRDGYEGGWLFRLTFSPEVHPGVPLYTFYVALGHLARLTGLSLITVYDVARLAGGLLMFAAIYHFVAGFTQDVTQRRVIWGLAVVGGGLGWLALVLGLWDPVPPDILASADAFPIQAVFVYAHMAAGIALGLWVADTLYRRALDDEPRWPGFDVQTVALALATIALIVTAPFILVPVGLSYGALVAGLWRKSGRLPLRAAGWGALVAVSGIPPTISGEWATSAANPVMHASMAQLITLAPPVGESLIAFGPMLLLALPGWLRAWRSGDLRWLALAAWTVAAFGLVYFPSIVQRRFLMGVGVPIAISAGLSLWRVILPALDRRWRPVVLGAVLGLAPLSAIVALVLPVVGIVSTPVPSFVGQVEADALRWLDADIPHDSLVLASPELSLYLPASGMRAVYGHHYETVNGPARLAEVEAFYAGSDCSVISREGVQVVVVGPYERALAGGAAMCAPGGPQVYVSPDGALAIYQVR